MASAIAKNDDTHSTPARLKLKLTVLVDKMCVLCLILIEINLIQIETWRYVSNIYVIFSVLFKKNATNFLDCLSSSRCFR